MSTKFCDPSLGTGSDNGSDWENAYKTLQGGIDGCGSGDALWVKARTVSVGTVIDFDNTNDISMYGGFATNLTGTNGSVAGRDLVNNITILDAGAARRCIAITKGSLIDGFKFYNSGDSWNCSTIAGTITLSMKNCIWDNTGGTGASVSSGGVLVISGAATCTFEDCTFTQGKASYGGLVDEASTTTATFKRCTFSDGTATAYGAAIRHYYGTCALEDCIVEDCVTTPGNFGGGGAIDQESPTVLTLLRCIFRNNSTAASSGKGGACVWYSGTGNKATNCVFYGNSATYGSALAASTTGTVVTVTNCTFSDNSASNATGGAVYARANTTFDIVNSILYDNTNGEILATGTVTCTYSDVKGGYTGTGNVDDDPHFLGSGSNPYNFGTTTSSAIDSGNAGATNYPTTTILGGARVDHGGVTNTGAGTPAYSDMGAYEMAYTAPATTAPLLLLFN